MRGQRPPAALAAHRGHNALFAAAQSRPGRRAISTDTCVPISRLAESLEGAHKIPHLEEEAGAEAIALMRQIKRSLDPQNLLNPGKMFTLDAA